MFNRTEMYFTGYSLVTTTLLLRFNIERRCNRSRTTVNQPSTQSLIAIVSTAVLCHIWSPWVKRCRQSRDFKKFGSAAAQQLRMGLSTSKNTPLPRRILSLVVKRYQRTSKEWSSRVPSFKVTQNRGRNRHADRLDIYDFLLAIYSNHELFFAISEI